jgi:hypothetical protein
MTGWLLNVLGVTNLSGRWYGFWSGFGANFGEFAIVGALVQLARRLIRHHAEVLAQAAQHHRERLDLQAAHHEDLRQHMSAQLNAHCADLKSHVSSVGSHVITSAVPVPQQLLDDIRKAPRAPAVVPQKLADIKPGGDPS